MVVNLLEARIVASSQANVKCPGEVDLLIPDSGSGKVKMVPHFPPVVIPPEREICFSVRIPKPADNAPNPEVRCDSTGHWTNEGLLAVNLLGPSNELLDSIPFLGDADLNAIPQPYPLHASEAPKEDE
jgi:hypothetical protein